MENLPEIKDIQLPDGVSVFPLAYGWWVILAGIIFLFILIKLIVWGIKTSRKHYALKKLSQISVDSPVHAAVNMSELLRRICIVKYPQANSLYGNEWLQFLSEHTRNTLPEKRSRTRSHREERVGDVITTGIRQLGILAHGRLKHG